MICLYSSSRWVLSKATKVCRDSKEIVAGTLNANMLYIMQKVMPSHSYSSGRSPIPVVCPLLVAS